MNLMFCSPPGGIGRSDRQHQLHWRREEEGLLPWRGGDDFQQRDRQGKSRLTSCSSVLTSVLPSQVMEMMYRMVSIYCTKVFVWMLRTTHDFMIRRNKTFELKIYLNYNLFNRCSLPSGLQSHEAIDGRFITAIMLNRAETYGRRAK